MGASFPSANDNNACNFFEHGLHPSAIDELANIADDDGMNAEPCNYHNIQTPTWDKVFLDQGFEYGECSDDSVINDTRDPRRSYMNIDIQPLDVMYAMMGRMLYPVGKHDDWQCMPYIKGVAGSGKTTIIEAFVKVYKESNTGVISNKIERQFGVAPLLNKYLVIGPELKKDCQLPQGLFQQMVGGERVTISEKNVKRARRPVGCPAVFCRQRVTRLVGQQQLHWTPRADVLFRHRDPRERPQQHHARRVGARTADVLGQSQHGLQLHAVQTQG